MQTQFINDIVAIVTTSPETVGGGGVPIFYAADPADRERIALYLSRILNAMVHDLENGTYFLSHH
ncbi:MAG TPA: hypothetical protein GXX50_00900 [Firmicutes bacterium]|uniref:capping complex subunit for YIEGIA n=1 Tax=Gelria sp. Kuro-4 TaxID=2796927 RepID=UPI0019A4F9FA|nr:hypothetical protein [Gelria sp. Kuro-4]BCV25090.1 hypothetical protein kuro4_18630 [Gelria sp. Kuro-4]HHV56311.1 hypothetical protein [Bacillota bacterium]